MIYAGNAKYLVAFNERNARDKFVDDHPSYYSEYANDARTYPQFNMVRSHSYLRPIKRIKSINPSLVLGESKYTIP